METNIKIFDKLDVATDLSNIEDCHRLKSSEPKKVIIKFVRRKDANLIWKNKNKLKGMNLCSVGINNPVFINHNLCSYYKMLWWRCKKLWYSKYINAFWVSNGTLRLKLTESEHVHTITHSQDLDVLLPENELLRDEQEVPCFVCLVYFHLSLWFFVFILQFRCSYLHIFNILAAILLFYLALMEIYTKPFYFIDIFVSIVTQHMIIYESFVW